MWVGMGASGEAEKKRQEKLTLLERRHLSREAQGWGMGGSACGRAESLGLLPVWAPVPGV